MNENEIRKMFSTSKEIANHYDSIKDIKNTIKYSFIVCEEDPEDTVCVTKIVYWACFFKEYDDIIRLMGIIRESKIQVEKMKQIFFRETKNTLKELMIKYYIDTMEYNETSKKIKSEKMICEHLREFYTLITNVDIYEIYDAYVKLLSQ